MTLKTIRRRHFDFSEGFGRSNSLNSGGRDKKADHRTAFLNLPLRQDHSAPSIAAIFARQLHAGQPVEALLEPKIIITPFRVPKLSRGNSEPDGIIRICRNAQSVQFVSD